MEFNYAQPTECAACKEWVVAGADLIVALLQRARRRHTGGNCAWIRQLALQKLSAGGEIAHQAHTPQPPCGLTLLLVVNLISSNYIHFWEAFATPFSLVAFSGDWFYDGNDYQQHIGYVDLKRYNKGSFLGYLTIDGVEKNATVMHFLTFSSNRNLGPIKDFDLKFCIN